MPIDVTLDGIETEVKEVQERKAKLPIDVTLDGIETEVKEVQ